MQALAFVIIAVCAGMLIPLQGAINSSLSGYLGNSAQAAFVSFVVGTLALAIFINVAGYGFPALNKMVSVPKTMLLGGVLGALFIFANIYLIPKIGLTRMVVSLVFGQIAFSLVSDHYGLINSATNPITLRRLLGAGLVFLGVVLVFVREK